MESTGPRDRLPSEEGGQKAASQRRPSSRQDSGRVDDEGARPGWAPGDFGIDPLRQFQQQLRDGEINFVLVGAIAGFIVGLMLWGTVLLGFINAVDGFSGSSDSPPVTEAGETAACDNAAGDRQTEGAVSVRSCATATPALPTPTATVPPTPTIAPTSSNRFNCDRIKGTEYLSDEERTWYLANCVTR